MGAAVHTTMALGTVQIVLGLASSEWQSQDMNPGLPDLQPLISPNCPHSMAPEKQNSEEWPTHPSSSSKHSWWPCSAGGRERSGTKGYNKRCQPIILLVLFLPAV